MITKKILKHLTPTEIRRVLDSDITFTAVANAAGITANMTQPSKHTLQDNINLAARNLAYLECTGKIDWGNAAMDWETLCSRVGPIIEGGCNESDLAPEKILKILNGA